MATTETLTIAIPGTKVSILDPIGILSEYAGAPDAAIRLILSIFAGYPIAAFYRCVIVPRATTGTLHHFYFAFCGISLCIFNYGFETYHSFIAISVTYLLIRLLYNLPLQLVIINFVFQMTYLLTGYYFTASNDYDILWTMPQCVLALRLIGFTFDVADGRLAPEKRSKDQQETALEKLPKFLELCAYAYFPCSFLVGPQFPFRRYKRFVSGEFRQHSGSIRAGVMRMLLGVFYLSVRQIGATFLPDDYFFTDAYREGNFLWRIICLGIWGRHTLYKYIACWLLTEGALMCLGLTYAGKTADGEDDWSGCSNIKVWLFEVGTTMQHYVHAFNLNTNHWVAQYVYKRLKFLNNRTISYAAALTFLAVWHGFHSGYYVTFIMEYLIVTAEKQMETVYAAHVVPSSFGHLMNDTSVGKCLKYVSLKFYDLILMGFCMAPFSLFEYSRYKPVLADVSYFGIVYVGAWFAFYQIYKLRARALKREREGSAKTD